MIITISSFDILPTATIDNFLFAFDPDDNGF